MAKFPLLSLFLFALMAILARGNMDIWSSACYPGAQISDEVLTAYCRTPPPGSSVDLQPAGLGQMLRLLLGPRNLRPEQVRLPPQYQLAHAHAGLSSVCTLHILNLMTLGMDNESLIFRFASTAAAASVSTAPPVVSMPTATSCLATAAGERTQYWLLSTQVSYAAAIIDRVARKMEAVLVFSVLGVLHAELGSLLIELVVAFGHIANKCPPTKDDAAALNATNSTRAEGITLALPFTA
ncbi:hypothetical protein PG996_011354 [Apiospora saccharicola]|uniref:Uncharacterized protein n=1 Tax=Apiospora saccharicola TaxID=335842 RepID=A0ABR1UET6_9PEZI